MPQYQIFHIIHLFYKEIHYAVFLLIKKDTLTMKKYLHDKKKQPLNKAAILFYLRIAALFNFTQNQLYLEYVHVFLDQVQGRLESFAQMNDLKVS